MKSQNVSLLEKIEDFCRKANIAESTFGYLVVNDGKLCRYPIVKFRKNRC